MGFAKFYSHSFSEPPPHLPSWTRLSSPYNSLRILPYLSIDRLEFIIIYKKKIKNFHTLRFFLNLSHLSPPYLSKKIHNFKTSAILKFIKGLSKVKIYKIWIWFYLSGVVSKSWNWKKIQKNLKSFSMQTGVKYWLDETIQWQKTKYLQNCNIE